MLFGFGAAAPAAIAAPDLVVEQMQVNPETGANGASVHVTVEIRNQGSSSSLTSTTRLRINGSSSSVSSTDPILCNISTPVIAAGASTEVGCTTAVSGRPPGTSYIWSIADVNKTAGQENTTNDRGNVAYEVTDQLPPDLVVQSISLSPKQLVNGDELSVGVTIKNVGSVRAAASTTRIRINQSAASVASNDPVLCNVSTAAIEPGASVAVGCTPTISSRPPGTNYVWAIADVNKTAGQTDTTNDRASSAIVISDEVTDLVIDSIEVAPAIAANGKPLTVTATIRNQGSVDAPATVTRVRINQDPLAIASTDAVLCSSVPTAKIPAGGTVEVSCKPTINNRPAGTNYVWVVVDSTNLAGQSDRTNDRANVAIEIDPSSTPDMTIRTLTVSPTSAETGSGLTITARVANDGKVDAPASKTRFLLSTSGDEIDETAVVLCDQVNTVALVDGSSVLVNCKPKLPLVPAGPAFIWAVADATGLTGEGDVTNNAASTPFTVKAGPVADLVVESVLATPEAASSGDQVAITVRIRNAGTAAALASTATVRLGASATEIAETDPIVCDALATPEIAAGAAADLVCAWTIGELAPGTVYLWATADVTSTAGQLLHTNDSTNSAFTVVPKNAPDLVVKRLVVKPNALQNGQQVVILARVTNNGRSPAAASVTTFRINQDRNDVGTSDSALCAGRPTPPLAAGQTARVRCVATIQGRPVGENAVWAIADATGTSGQFDRSNDRRRTLVVVTETCTDPSVAPQMHWPVEQPRIVQDYASYGSVPLGRGQLGYHAGVDLTSHLDLPTEELPVYAAADGEVVAARDACPSPADAVVDPPNGTCAGGWGNHVVIRHGDGIYSVYAHLGEVAARTGCIVAGERIGTVGSSGATSIPPHLHFDAMADLPDFARKSLGTEYYRESHPFAGRSPEDDDGTPTVHLDPRDFLERSRIRLSRRAVASRGDVTGGTPAYLARNQEYVSYGELVPGYFLIDLPSQTLPEDGPPYGDDVRYGWVRTTRASVVETGAMPGSVRVDGVMLYELDGVGSNFASLRAKPEAGAAEISRAWGGQQLAPAGAPVTESATAQVWQPVYVPGTTAKGPGRPRVAWLEADLLGPAPAH